MMYAKLALRNVKRSARDYLIYLITLILCVGMFYAFISLSSPYYNASLPVEANLVFFYKYMKYSVFSISAVLVFLIKYVNNYMIKRKKKEFAIQTMMGMEQRTTAYLFFIETLCISFVAIAIGVILGSLLSQVITAIILNYFEQTYHIYVSLYPDTILITIAFYTVVFCIVGVLNIREIRRIKIIDMLNDDKKNEKLKVSHPKFIIIGLLTIFSLIACIVLIVKKIYIMIAILLLLFSIYGFYYCLSGVILFIKSKFKKIKYKDENLFLFGQITSKLKTTSKTMTTITVTLMSAAIALVMATVLSSWALGYLNLRAVFDIQLFSRYNKVENIQNITNINYDFILDYMKEKEYKIDSYVQTKLYFLNSEDFNYREDKVLTLAICLSDYNKLREMAGIETITLAENTFTTQWYQSVPWEEITAFLNDHKTIQVEGSTFQLSNKEFYKDSFGEMLYNSNSDLVYVLLDEICEKLTVARINFYVNTDKKLGYDFADELSNYLYQYIHSSENLTENMVDFRIKTLQYNEGLTGSLMSLFLLVYGGIVLIIMCFTILSLQQLSDAREHKYRFHVLRKIGVEDSVIGVLLFKQMFVWFIVPIIIAIIGSAVILNYIINNFLKQILAFIGADALALNIIIVCVIIIIILACYFIATWVVFKRNIHHG